MDEVIASCQCFLPLLLSLVPTARTPSSFLRDPGTLIWHRIVGESPAANCGDGRQERKDSRLLAVAAVG
jgi:hypothetical protein